MDRKIRPGVTINHVEYIPTNSSIQLIVKHLRNLKGKRKIEFQKFWSQYKKYYIETSVQHTLLTHCIEFIEIWWDPDKFIWFLYNHLLFICGNQYKHIWEKDYLMWKLQYGT